MRWLPFRSALGGWVPAAKREYPWFPSASGEAGLLEAQRAALPFAGVDPKCLCEDVMLLPTVHAAANSCVFGFVLIVVCLAQRSEFCGGALIASVLW